MLIPILRFLQAGGEEETLRVRGAEPHQEGRSSDTPHSAQGASIWTAHRGQGVASRVGPGSWERQPEEPLPPPADPSRLPTGYEAPCLTVLPPQSSEDVASSGPEDCSFFPNGAFDHCLSHIPSIYTDT